MIGRYPGLDIHARTRDGASDRRTPVRPGGRPAMSVNVALLGAEDLKVEPGQTTTCQLSVANTSTIVEQFTILMLGEAAEWSDPDPPVVSLFPGAPADRDPAVLASPSVHHPERRSAVRGEGDPFQRARRIGHRGGRDHGRVLQRRGCRARPPGHDRADHRPPEARRRQPRQRPAAGRGLRPRCRRRPQVQDPAEPR